MVDLEDAVDDNVVAPNQGPLVGRMALAGGLVRVSYREKMGVRKKGMKRLKQKVVPTYSRQLVSWKYR